MKAGHILPLVAIFGLAVHAQGAQQPKPQIPAAQAKVTRQQQVTADFRSISTALMSYKMNAGVYPTTEQGLKAIVEKPVIDPVPRRWIRISKRIPQDPWGSSYRYRFPGTKDPLKFELISDGPDKTPGTADDLAYQDP